METMQTTTRDVAQPIIVNIEGIDYLLGPSYNCPQSVNSDYPSIEQSPHPRPVTVLLITGITEITEGFLENKYEQMSSDDVWNRSFLKHVLMQIKDGTVKMEDKMFVSDPTSQLYLCLYKFIPPGPYVLLNSNLHKVYRLYPDTLGAFVCGVVPTIAERYPVRYDFARMSYQNIPSNLIPVPSRIYGHHTHPLQILTLPLARKRIAIKDIFDLRGVKTTACSKAYEACQQPAISTAASIQKLIDQGAVIVGKLKTTPFASGMGPRDWVDYQPPFNPRGDGYLDPECSSAGSGAALAGYEWLDYTIGSDTLGSMVGPACGNGLFGLRPSHGRVGSDGVVPISSFLDTPGNFSRDVSDFSIFTNDWLNSSPKEVELEMPTKLTIPIERYADYAPEVLKAMESFIEDFEKAAKVLRTNITMEELWKTNAPANQAKTSFQETFSTTLAHIQLYGHYNNTESFRKQYKEKFGREPYAEPLLQYKWNLGANLTEQQLFTALKEKETFANFLQDHVFANNGVMLLPYGGPNVPYRDTYDGSLEECGKRWQGFDVPVTAFSALGGGPAVAFPAGQVLYDSKVTKSKEYRPIGMMLLGASGADEYLIELLKHVLVESGRSTSVKTGKVMF